jgi:S-layer protein
MSNKVQVTTTLVFLDGSVTLTNGARSTKVSINGFNDDNVAKSQLLTTKYADVKINADDSNTNAATYFADLPVNDTTTFTLTVNPDTFVGTTGNDVFNATATGTLSAFDNLTGGAGTDTLNAYYATELNTTALGLTITGMENVTIQGSAGITTDVTTWGTTALTVANAAAGNIVATAAATTTVSALNSFATGNVAVAGGLSQTVTGTGGTITLSGSVGAVVVNTNTVGTQGAIGVTGGTTITVTQNKVNAVNTTSTAGAVTVTGSALTTAVSVLGSAAATASLTVAGRTNGAVTVNDVNFGTTTTGTISSVTVNGYTTLSINDSALTTLSVANGSGNIIIDNSTATVFATTLAVTVNGLTGGTLDDADRYTTLNVTTATANSTLSNITFGGVTALNVAGTNVLTLTSAAGLTQLITATVSGSAGLTADLSGATVTSVNTTATTGTSRITIDGSKATYAGGAGVDLVTTNAATVSKAISLGDGNDQLTYGGSTAPTATINGGSGTDTLSLTAALAATSSATSTFAGLVTNFENLILTGATNQTIDLAMLGNYANVSTSGGNGLTLSNFANNSTLNLTGAGTAYTLANVAFTSGVTDVINLTLSDGSGAGVAFASTGITAANVETFAITTVDSQASPTGTFLDSVTLLGNSVSTITVSGNAGLALTAASTALTSVNASGITLGGFTFTSGATTSAATITGSATGTNTINLSAATVADTYIGGTGIDNVTIANSLANTITTGAGNDIVSVGVASAASIGAQGVNTITLGADADVVTLKGVALNGNSYSYINDAAVGDTIAFADVSTTAAALATDSTFTTAKVTLASTAAFADYLNAAASTMGAGTAANFAWFQYGGNTYIVDDTTTTGAFVNGADTIVQLTGLVTVDGFTAATTNGGGSFVLA